MSHPLISAAESLRNEVNRLQFAKPVTHIYNPLDYAWEPHRIYLERFGEGTKRVLFLGMNPGPWGMSQTGIPFGEVELVRDWMGINAPVSKPPVEHPKRIVEGFACQKSEVSGRRLWGFFKERFGAAENFFRDHLVLNYCPLVFMEESSRNRTPDKLPKTEQAPLRAACDAHLQILIDTLQPEFAVGVGKFAEACFKRINVPSHTTVTTVLHPSPASPAANRGWAEAAAKQLHANGVWPS
ncbi:MAG: single-stranded DNA-binding protein [Verrucomicrobiota bacterium JB023]|nr:single-stranded DNA-binding protein [Verrucomicrobiota bacterium JB023]